jgi:hypothetical protein
VRREPRLFARALARPREEEFEFFDGHGREADRLAARADGRQQARRARGDEDEVRRRGRLFERLQERVRRRLVQAVGLGDDEDAGRALEGPVVALVVQIAHRIDERAAVIRDELSHVSVAAPDDFLVRVPVVRRGELEVRRADARGALAAALDPDLPHAVERPRQLQREQLFPQPLLAREEQRARHAPLPEHPPQRLLRALVADE